MNDDELSRVVAAWAADVQRGPDELIMLHESPRVPVIPEAPDDQDSITVTAFRFGRDMPTIFVGDGDGPQLAPDGARALAAALATAADAVDREVGR